MQDYRDLEIHPKGSLEEFIELVSNQLPPGWARSTETEDSIRSNMAHYFVFTCDGTRGPEAAALFFLKREDGALYVCNIVPQAKFQLSRGEYNAILDDFRVGVLEALPCRDDHLVLAFSDKIEPSVILGEAGFKLLERFALTSNRSTGSAHPSDRQKWFDLISYVHRNEIEFGPHLLERYLVEVAKWPEDVASDIACEFSFGLGLLSHSRANG